MKKVALLVLILSFFYSLSLNAAEIKKKKILYVNSYHSGLFWSDGIERGIKDTLKKSKSNVELKIIYMDTKNNQAEQYKKKAALKAKNIIENYKPDVVITSDDNAAKYLIVPFFYNSSIPFVFCGVNGSANEYGFPTKNVTGMIEVQLIPQLLSALKEFTRGNKVGFLKGDSFSTKKEALYFEKILNKKINKRFVKSIKEWKEEYLTFQKNVDVLLIGDSVTINGWKNSHEDIRNFIKNNTLIPTASWDSTISDLSLITYANKPEEQGIWSATTALEILNGKDISKIPLSKNKKTRIFVNKTLIKKLNIVFPFEIVDNAVIVD